MKVNVSVEIDWIEEDGSIDDEIKHELILGVKRAISKTCMKDMETQSKLAFDDAVQQASAKISKKALDFADAWLENEVEITDKWGDKQDKITVKGLIKRSFDNLLERKVDSNGKFSSSYGADTKLIEYLTNKRVEDEVSKRMKDFGKGIDDRIKKAIDKSIKDNVSDRFAQMVIGAAKQDYLDQKAINQETP